MKKIRPEWEVARDRWLTDLQSTATKEQRTHYNELRESGLFEPLEMIQRAFGWRCPTAEKVWTVDNKTGEAMGTHEAVEYLLRVVLGIPTDGSKVDVELGRESKKNLQALVITGYEKGHVASESSSIKDAARVAVNDTFKKLGIKE